MIAAGKGSYGILIRDGTNQVSSVFILPGAFGGSDVPLLKAVRPLPGENGVAVLGSQSIRQVLLNAKAMASVFGRAVHGIAQDAERLWKLGD